MQKTALGNWNRRRNSLHLIIPLQILPRMFCKPICNEPHHYLYEHQITEIVANSPFKLHKWRSPITDHDHMALLDKVPFSNGKGKLGKMSFKSCEFLCAKITLRGSVYSILESPNFHTNCFNSIFLLFIIRKPLCSAPDRIIMYFNPYYYRKRSPQSSLHAIKASRTLEQQISVTHIVLPLYFRHLARLLLAKVCNF